MTLEAAGEGGFVGNFPDFPEGWSQGDDHDEALRQAEDLLEEMILGYMADGQVVPGPSAPNGRSLIRLPGLTAAKLEIYRAMHAAGLDKRQLATAAIVDDPDVKRTGLDAFVERLYPGRNAAIRPISPQELKGTMLMSMVIEETSAKIRTGGPVDDEDDYALDCWAGVIPVEQRLGAAIPDERLRPGIAAGTDIAAFAEGVRLADVLAALADHKQE